MGSSFAQKCQSEESLIHVSLKNVAHQRSRAVDRRRVAHKLRASVTLECTESCSNCARVVAPKCRSECHSEVSLASVIQHRRKTFRQSVALRSVMQEHCSEMSLTSVVQKVSVKSVARKGAAQVSFESVSRVIVQKCHHESVHLNAMSSYFKLRAKR